MQNDSYEFKNSRDRPHVLEIDQGELPPPMDQMQLLNPQSRFVPTSAVPDDGELEPGAQASKNSRLIDELVFLKKEIQLLKQIHYNSDLAQQYYRSEKSRASRKKEDSEIRSNQKNAFNTIDRQNSAQNSLS